MNRVSQKFWFDDPRELIENWYELIPLPEMSYERSFNAISRMLGCAIIGKYVFDADPLLCIVIAAFFTMIYSRKNKPPNWAEIAAGAMTSPGTIPQSSPGEIKEKLCMEEKTCDGTGACFMESFTQQKPGTKKGVVLPSSVLEKFGDYESEYPVKEYIKNNPLDSTYNKKPMNSDSISELAMMGMHMDNDPYRLKAGYKYMNGLNKNDKEQFEKRRMWNGTYCGSPNYTAPTYWKYTDEKSERDRTNKYRW